MARGAIGNPWIFGEVRALAAGQPLPPPPSLHQQRAIITEHLRLAEQLYGPKRCTGMMCRFGVKYSRLHPRGIEVRDAFVAATTPFEWRQVLETWYAEDLPGVRRLAEP